jgi:hypothetical protein
VGEEGIQPSELARNWDRICDVEMRLSDGYLQHLEGAEDDLGKIWGNAWVVSWVCGMDACMEGRINDRG